MLLAVKITIGSREVIWISETLGLQCFCRNDCLTDIDDYQMGGCELRIISAVFNGVANDLAENRLEPRRSA